MTILSRLEHTIVHEFCHAYGDSAKLDESPEWLILSGWQHQTGLTPDDKARYIEKRIGWPKESSDWTYDKSAWFIRPYSAKSPAEDFADCAMSILVGWTDKFDGGGEAKRNWVVSLLGDVSQRSGIGHIRETDVPEGDGRWVTINGRHIFIQGAIGALNDDDRAEIAKWKRDPGSANKRLIAALVDRTTTDLRALHPGAVTLYRGGSIRAGALQSWTTSQDVAIRHSFYDQKHIYSVTITKTTPALSLDKTKPIWVSIKPEHEVLLRSPKGVLSIPIHAGDVSRAVKQREAEQANEDEGRWVTMRGRHVFIKKGENPEDALAKSLNRDAAKYDPTTRNPVTDEEIKIYHDRKQVAIDKVMSLMTSEFIDTARLAQYHEAIEKTMDRMTLKALERIQDNLTGFDLYPNVEQLGNKYVSLGGKALDVGKSVGGFYLANFDAGHAIRGILFLDGGGGEDPKYIYAHELGHVIDGGYRYSASGEWVDAWIAEINTSAKPLSQYATTNRQEGFAEFVRLATWSPKEALTSFPKSYAFLKSKGLA